MKLQLQRVERLVNRISLNCLDKTFNIIVEYDKHQNNFIDITFEPRIYIQLAYNSSCTKGGTEDSWKGRKWYLSEFMTDDEIIKTCYTAFEACVKHEIMEGFKIDNVILFNPHVNFEELIKISNKEVKRK